METMVKDKKIGLISLGCDKNRVDSEKILGLIDGRAVITNDIEEANIIIVNSCAFLESARKEAIDTVLECNELRSNNLEKIVLTGCLPERYIDDLFDALTEVDLFMGILDYDLLFEGLELCYKGERVNFVHKNKNFDRKKRVLTTPCHYFYLKIADGCNNKCTYCLIPSIRGAYRSTPINELISEVKSLGYTEEVILVAQDVTRYGVDFDGKSHIVELIKELSKLDEVGSIRLLYCYPDMVSDELIDEIKNNDKVIKYLDIAGDDIILHKTSADIDEHQFTLDLGKETDADLVTAEHAGKIVAGVGSAVQRGKGKQLTMTPELGQNHIIILLFVEFGKSKKYI